MLKSSAIVRYYKDVEGSCMESLFAEALGFRV